MYGISLQVSEARIMQFKPIIIHFLHIFSIILYKDYQILFKLKNLWTTWLFGSCYVDLDTLKDSLEI